MTEAQALREDNFMKPIRGFDDEKAFCKSALMQHIKNIYKDFDNERPSARRTSRKNMVIPNKGIPNFRSYMDVKTFLEKVNTGNDGKPLSFQFEDKTVKVSSFGKPYYHDLDSMPDLSFEDSGRFYKTLYNYKFLLEEAINTQVKE